MAPGLFFGSQSFPVLRMCDRCLARKGKDVPDAMSFRNFGNGAAWPMTRINHNSYMLLDAASISPWSKVPGWRFETVSFDFMHMVYLGHGRDLFASSIHVLLKHEAFGPGEIDEVLERVHQQVHSDCAAAGTLDQAFLGTDNLFLRQSNHRSF